MAEWNEKDFEQEFAKKFLAFDESIEIPEIPDVEEIFEKAEKEEKPNVVPLRRYSKYIAAAAAVVLIAVSVQVIGAATSASAEKESNLSVTEKADIGNVFSFLTADAQEPEAIMEEAEEPVAQESDGLDPTPEQPSQGESNPNAGKDALGSEVSSSTVNSFTNSVNEALRIYFADEKKEANPTYINDDYGEIINENLNKKRSIEIIPQENFVSVTLFDSSAGNEIIKAFWIEGKYESSYSEGEYYIINIVKKVTAKDLENGSYLPMVGDDIAGTYFIDENSIFVPEKITEGEISLSVEIDIGTGEYRIYASLI